MMKNQAGMTLMEIMVALAVGGIVIAGLMTLNDQMSRSITSLQEKKSRYQFLNNIYQSIRANTNRYMVFTNEQEAERALDVDKLPWYVQSGRLGPVSACGAATNCDKIPIRMGYAIYPNNSQIYRDIYTLKIRVYDIEKEFKEDFVYLVVPR